jgi:F-box interacting protein
MPNLKLDLPSDVTTDILCQLPVKTLLRFRCVSKRWCSQIDGPDFIKLHLSHSLATKSNLSLVLRNWYLYSVEFDSLRTATEINPPLNVIWGITDVFGSCNGLVAVCNSEEEIVLWNPSTRKHQRLPTMPVEDPKGDVKPRRYTFYGFGPDPISDDYKVVRMVQFDGDHHGSVQVRVYSLKTNSWRGMKDDAIPYFVHNLFPYGRGCGALASGALHWVAPGESGGCCVIVAFDLGVEEFRIVPQPDGVDGGSKVDVVVLEGRLCMLCNYDSGCVDVWVMKEYGLKESWTKVFEVSRDCFDVCSQSSFNRNFGQVKPLAYSKSGDKILLEVDMDKLLWYDFRRKRAERVRIEGAPIPFSADVYVESLVPLGGGGGGMDRKTQQPPEEKKKSKRKKIM